MSLLANPGLAPLTNDTAVRLQELLQPSPAPALAEVPRPGPAPPLFNLKITTQVLRRTPKGSGSALGGGRWEHWRVLLAVPSALDALHEVLARVASGDMPGEVAAALALSKVLGLSKPDGGVRPIAVPSLLRRLAGKALCRACKDSLSAILGRQQFAVGLAAGTETLAHSVRALVEADPELVLLALDAQNAF